MVGGEIEMACGALPYLGSVISRNGDVMECRIAKASKAFDCLRGPIFNNSILSIEQCTGLLYCQC